MIEANQGHNLSLPKYYLSFIFDGYRVPEWANTSADIIICYNMYKNLQHVFHHLNWTICPYNHFRTCLVAIRDVFRTLNAKLTSFRVVEVYQGHNLLLPRNYLLFLSFSH